MVELLTSQAQVQARGAGQVSRSGSAALIRAGRAAQGAADTFTEFYEGKAAIENDLILAQAQSDWSTNYAERSKNAGSGFAKGMLADYDAYVFEVMGRDGTPERGRDKLEAAFSEYRIGLEGKALQREAAAAAAASATAAANAQRLRANAIVLDNSLMEETIEGATTDAERSLYLRTGLTARMEADPQGVIDSVGGGQWNAILTPSQTQSFMTLGRNELARNAKEADAAAEVEQRELIGALEEEVNFISTNGALPVDSELTDENIDTVFEGNPEGATEMKRVRDNAVMDAENENAVSTASPSVIDDTLEELRAAVAEPGRTAEDVARLNSYVAAISARNQKLTDDGAAFMAQNSDVLSGLLTQYQGQEDADTQLSVANRYTTEMGVRYDAMGVPASMRSLLPKAIAEGYVAQFNSMGNDVAAQALKQFKDSWGGSAPQIMAELSRAGLVSEYLTAMRYSSNPGLSAEIVSLSGVTSTELREGVIGINDADKALMAELEDYRAVFEFGAANQDAAKLFNDNYSIAERLVYSRMRGGMDGETAVVDVVSRMFPEDVVQYDNMEIIIPKGATVGGPNGFVFGLDTLLSEERIAAANITPFDDPSLPDFADAGVLNASLLTQGVWTNNDTGDGVALMIRVDGELLRVNRTLPDGSVQPYEIKFSHRFDYGGFDYGGFDYGG